MTVLDSALRYAARGWPIFPVHSPLDDGRCSCGRSCDSPAKHPRTQRGLIDASTDPATVTGWWQRWPQANVGLRTGNRAGVIVLDVDPRHGGDETLHDLERAHGPLPRTTTVVTPSGGQHIYFRHPGGSVPNSAGALGVGLDVRGDGGYVLTPPSVGVNGRRYELDERAPLAPMPEWLTPQRETTTAAAPSTWLQMLRGGIADGYRNTDLAKLTGHLLRRYVDVDVCAELIHMVNRQCCRPPLSVDEVNVILDSIAAREARRRSAAS
jgi:hypothetical protein